MKKRFQQLQNFLPDGNRAVYRALVKCFDSSEKIDLYFLAQIPERNEIRKVIANECANGDSKKYESFFRKILSEIDSNKSSQKRAILNYLSSCFSYLPDDLRSSYISYCIQQKSSETRVRCFRLCYVYKNYSKFELIESYHKYFDDHCARILIENLSISELKKIFPIIFENASDAVIAKLFIKLNFHPERNEAEIFRRKSPISYIYYLAKAKKNISDALLLETFETAQDKSEKEGLFIWCL